MPRFKSRDFVTSLLFNGTTDTVVVPHNANQLLTGGFTLSAWIRPRTLGESSLGNVMDKSTGLNGANGYVFQLTGTAQMRLRVDSISVNSATNSVVLNQWQHVLVTVAADATVTHYINGAVSGTPSATSALSAITTTNALTIGNRSGATDRTFDGWIDEPRIWNRVLTAQEISDLCFNGTYSTTGLIGEYLFNEGSGTVATDSSSSTNNGVITGAAYSADVPMRPRFLQRNQNASVLVNGIDGVAGNALSIPNNASLSPTTAVTTEIWCRPTALKAGTLFDNSTSGTTDSYYCDFTSSLSLRFYTTIGGVAKSITGTASRMKLNEWNFVQYTYDGAALRIFLNGAQLAESTAATGTMGANTGALRIGAYYSGGVGLTFQGSLSSPRVYAAGVTLAEHQDRYYKGVTSAALTAALKLDLNTQLGAGSTATDLSGLGNNATLGASASWTSDSPFKSRKASVNANMVRNGDFEYAPPFTAATTTASRWIDGTSAGSTTNDLFGWFMAPSWTGTDGTASFDSSVFYSGAYSLKINKTAATGGTSGGAVGLGTLVSPTVATQRQYFVPVVPSRDYRVTFRLKTSSISALNSAGARGRILMYDGVNTSSTSSASSSYVTGTNDWQLVTLNFTTTATTTLVNFWCQLDNETGTAWFDDISLTPVYPEGRVPANGNLVKNFDFEVIPAFTAAGTTSSRWIDGTAAGSTTNWTYKWSQIIDTASCAISIDGTVSHSGSGSLKVDCLDATGKGRGVYGSRTGTGSSLLVSELNLYAIRVLPSTSYTMTYWIKTLDTLSAGGKVAVHEHDGAGVRNTSTSSTAVNGTTDWTQISLTFTTAATTQYLVLSAEIATAGSIKTVWFDDFYLAPTTNPGRVLIT